MKKAFIYFLLFTFYFLLFSPAFAYAQNIVSINIGDHLDEFNQVAKIVGPGGWVVVMACPGDGDKLAEITQAHPDINLIIRGHYPGQPLNRDWALSWVATLGKIPSNNKIYFVPWNEPNQEGSADYGLPQEVVKYTQIFKDELRNAGIDNKISFLSPALNISHQNYSSYISNLKQAGGGSYFAQFDGIALNMYDLSKQICGEALCANEAHLNPAKAGQILREMEAAGKPAFITESGTAGENFYFKFPPTSSSPLYEFVKKYLAGGGYPFALPSYDLAGERGHSWSLYEPDDVIRLLEGYPDKGCCTTPTGFSDETRFENWLSINSISQCPGKSFVFAVAENYCGACGGGSGGSGKRFLDTSPGLVCADFIYDYEKVSEQPRATASAVLAATSGEDTVKGEIFLENGGFPDFSDFEKVSRGALPALLPAHFLTPQNPNSLEIPSGSWPLKVKHYLFGKTGDGGFNKPFDSNEIEEQHRTDDRTPSWWTSLLAENTALYHLFWPGKATRSLSFKIGEVPDKIPDVDKECVEGSDFKPEALNELRDDRPQFWGKSIWEEIIRWLEKFLRITRKVQFRDASRGIVWGGEAMSEKSDGLSSFLPAAFLPKENESAIEEGGFRVEMSSGEEFPEEFLYEGQGAVGKRYCGLLCSVYPAKFKPKDCACK